MKQLWQKLLDVKFKGKLIMLYAFVMLLPLSAMTLYTYNRTTREYVAYQNYSSNQGFDQAISYLTFRFSRIARLFDMIQLDQKINDIISSTPSMSDVNTHIVNHTFLRSYISSISDDQEQIHPKIYLKGNFYYANEGTQFFPMDEYMDEKWMQESLRGWGWLTYCPPSYLNSDEDLAMVRPIRDLDNYRSIVGVVRVDIPLKEIEELIQRAATTPNSLTYIESLDGVQVITSDSKMMAKYQLTTAELKRALYQGDQKSVAQDRKLASLRVQLIPDSRLVFVSLTPNMTSSSALWKNQVNLLMIVLAIVLIGLLLSLPIANSISKGITAMDRRMQNVQHGDISSRFTPHSRDEIGNLMRSFNYMLDRIEELASEQYTLGKELRTAELMALQSQINPHFLYNTLELINWMASKQMNREIKSVIHAMARFYRLSLSQGRDIITIGQEIELLQNYVVIQQMRFSNSIKLEVDVQDIEAYLIPKITLQPIVENAILHGILEKPSKQGVIKIRGTLADDWITLEIHDDGIGIEADLWESLISAPKTDRQASPSYGLYNIERRICLYFGLKQGLSCVSSPEDGTCIRIIIPARTVDAFPTQPAATRF